MSWHTHLKQLRHDRNDFHIQNYRKLYRKLSSKEKQTAIDPKQYALKLFACELGEFPTPIENAVEDLLISMDLYGFSQIPCGPYIVDFVLKNGAVVVECDGIGYHPIRNETRDRHLVNLGFRVLHLSGRTCFDRNASRQAIEAFLQDNDSLIKYCGFLKADD